MTEQQVRHILGKAIRPDGALHSERRAKTISWAGPLYAQDVPRVFLDGLFTDEELDAIVWWIRHQRSL